MPNRVLSIPHANAKTRAVRRVQDRHTIRTAEPLSDPSDTLLNALEAVTAFGAAPAYRRRQIERTVDALLMILDTMDGDPDAEPEEDCGELDHLPDDDSEPVRECMPVAALFTRQPMGVQHG